MSDKKEKTEQQITLTGATTAINSTAIIYLLYNNFTANEKISTMSQRNEIILSNMNMLNMQLRRWIAIFVNKHFEISFQVEEMKKVMCEQGKRIEELENIINSK
jgi:hypothetical protein